ncbi:hypothetical protein BDW71DRAFT_212445 [Aspergillus fruticulosus]
MVTEQVRKFRDKIIAPQDETPEEFEDKTTDKGDEDSDGQENAPKEVTEGQGPDGDALIAVDDEGCNVKEVYDENDSTGKHKRTLEDPANRKKGWKCFKNKN